MTALRQQMDADMVVRGMAVKTREAYLAAVAGLARFYQRSPDTGRARQSHGERG